MSQGRVNYDQIAPVYDMRDRSRRDATATALRGLADEVGARRILEVGCGTGHWLAELTATDATVYGLDRSRGMLDKARERNAAFHLIHGQAEALPSVEGAFDLVYCVNALHHFDDPRAFIDEAWRLLRPGGALATIGMDPHSGLDVWYLYDYFPGTRETDLRRFPSWGTVADWMIARGFEAVAWRVAERIIDPKAGSEALGDPWLNKHATSQLILLSDEAYAAGVERMRRAVGEAETRGETIVFPSTVTLGMVTGWKGEAQSAGRMDGANKDGF